MTFSCFLHLQPAAYRADKNLCLLPRKRWSRRAPRTLEVVEAASQGLSPFYPAGQTQSQGQIGGHPCRARQLRAKLGRPHSAAHPAPPASFPSFAICSARPGTLVTWGRMVRHRMFLSQQSVFVSILQLKNLFILTGSIENSIISSFCL